ncbi:MAG: HNH endonuclease, partial [Oscillospiraceae bacterium]|nr:HNH endonuclease [Oscillospiraceae bacterium]
KISTGTRRLVYARDGHSCALCERTEVIHIHHILPRGRGGSNAPENLICLCPTCHAIAHGEYVLANQFPFDKETAEDAIYYYMELLAGGG